MNRTIFLSLILFASVLSAQQQDGLVRVIGDSLVGKMINGESIREVHGNVIITQDDVTITCDKAIQYIAKNEAELIGKVVVHQDSIVIKTDAGYYYGDSKTTFSKVGVTLFDGHVNLFSKIGYYYFDDKRADFYQNVKLYDSVTTMWSDKLTYYNDEDRAIAVGNIKIVDTANVVYADSLEHFRNTRKTFAFNNVRIYDKENKLAIFGKFFEDYGDSNYSKIFGEPLLIKIDTTSSGGFDTLVVSSKLMEAFGDSTKKLVATDSVKIVRSGFASLNNFSEFYQLKDEIYTVRRENDLSQPVIWNDEAQLIADTITIQTEKNKLKYMDLNSNASIISQNEKYNLRYDQISGKQIQMFFGENGLENTDVDGNVLSIYYLYEENEPNGLLKSSSEKAKIFFNDDEIKDVKLYGSPISEYHPENLVHEKEKDFTLPTFIIIKDRPVKDSLLQDRQKLVETLKEEFSDDGK